MCDRLPRVKLPSFTFLHFPPYHILNLRRSKFRSVSIFARIQCSWQTSRHPTLSFCRGPTAAAVATVTSSPCQPTSIYSLPFAFIHSSSRDTESFFTLSSLSLSFLILLFNLNAGDAIFFLIPSLTISRSGAKDEREREVRRKCEKMGLEFGERGLSFTGLTSG